LRIDVHAHYYTPEFMERMWGLGCTWRPTDQILNASGATPQRLDNLAAGGVDLQVLSVGAQQPYLAGVRDAVEGAQYANDFYKEAVERGGGHYAAFGCVPLPHVDAAIAEARRCLEELRFRGINLGCSVAGTPLDSPEFEPFWQELNRWRAVVFLHPLGLAAMMTDAFDLAFNVGGRFEDTVAAMRLVRSGLVDRFPDVRIIVPHLGGAVPFLWRGEGSPISAGLRRLYYDTVNQAPTSLRCACETVGADRLMLGTDYPYNTPQTCVSYVETSGLAPEQTTAILDGNAQRLLGL
jgi:aminocarboxymuconate-semialdehyde decarboxylase